MTTSPTTIHLVRHGLTEWNLELRLQGHFDSQLTEKGREQAKKAGALLASAPITHAFASPLGRTMETAQCIIGDRDIPLTPVEDLKEIGLGPLEGLLLEDAEKSYPEACHDFWHAPHRFYLPGAERYSEVQERVLGAIDRIFEAHKGETLLIVSHAMAIKTALAHFLKKDITELGDILLPENGSIATLQETRGTLALLNPKPEAICPAD